MFREVGSRRGAFTRSNVFQYFNISKIWWVLQVSTFCLPLWAMRSVFHNLWSHNFWWNIHKDHIHLGSNSQNHRIFRQICIIGYSTIYFFSVLKKLSGHISFYGTTNTPVLDFWWHILWHLLTHTSQRCIWSVYPEIHLCCNTCWPLDGQYGSQLLFPTCMFQQT